ncbi:MAG: site-2 protease family protein, partial [Rhodothermales bacterium]
MKNSLKIGSIAGIGIFLHWTFLVLIAGIFAFYLFQGNDVASALVGVALVIAVFGCVVLHELGHALTARRFDVPTRDITLYPIGGVARLHRIPEEPMKEFWIAVAGPAVNLAIAAVLFVFILLANGSLSPIAFERPSANFLTTLMWLNLILVGFNLLPAFPMDGGRVLRALLATRMDYARATQIAANVGQGMAILFGIVGLVGFNPILLFIALFVYVG